MNSNINTEDMHLSGVIKEQHTFMSDEVFLCLVCFAADGALFWTYVCVEVTVNLELLLCIESSVTHAAFPLRGFLTVLHHVIVIC